MNLDGKPIRKEVLMFAALMERMLRKHDEAKGEQGWKKDAPLDLFDRVNEEFKELYELWCSGTNTPQQLSDDAIDVANMLMMFLDSLEQLPPKNLEMIDDSPPAVDKTIDWADLSAEQFAMARGISDKTGMRPKIYGNGISPTRRGHFRLITCFMAGKTRMEWEIEGPELLVLLRQGAARVNVDHQPE